MRHLHSSKYIFSDLEKKVNDQQEMLNRAGIEGFQITSDFTQDTGPEMTCLER
jgi:hypothetical protein